MSATDERLLLIRFKDNAQRHPLVSGLLINHEDFRCCNETDEKFGCRIVLMAQQVNCRCLTSCKCCCSDLLCHLIEALFVVVLSTWCVVSQ